LKRSATSRKTEKNFEEAAESRRSSVMTDMSEIEFKEALDSLMKEIEQLKKQNNELQSNIFKK
jgi:hypothetical protein